jgi:hypothetical protein
VFSRLHRTIGLANVPELHSEIGGDAPETSLVAELFGERLGIEEVVKRSPWFAERDEAVTKVEPKLDASIQRRAALGQASEGDQSLLEVPSRLAISRSGRRLGPALMKVSDRLVPCLAVNRVVGQPFNVFGQPVGIEPLDGLHDLAMEGASPVLEQTAIGDLVGRACLKVYSRSGNRVVS